MKPKMTKVERDALHWVNKIRRAEGRKALARMPKGDISEIHSCPLARALNHGRVGVSNYLEVTEGSRKKIAAFKKAHLHQPKLAYDEEGIICFQMPKAFHRFVTWFDNQEDAAAEALVR